MIRVINGILVRLKKSPSKIKFLEISRKIGKFNVIYFIVTSQLVATK